MPNNRTNLAYTELGSGLAIVLLHAFPLNASIWSTVQKELSKTHRVIAVDLPGFGQSQPPRPFTIDSAAEDLHALLTELDALPCTLGGMSMGGHVTFAFADRYPDAASHLVFISTKAAGDDAPGKAGREKMLATVRSEGSAAVAEQMLPRLISDTTKTEQPALVKQLDAIIRSNSPLAIEYATVAMRDRPDRTPSLAKIAVPTLICYGENDAFIPLSVPTALQQQIKNAKLAIIPKAGHLCAIEQPAEFQRVVRELLQTGK
jgi:pimeloyl-ACP methyl ester carboxylesterase